MRALWVLVLVACGGGEQPAERAPAGDDDDTVVDTDTVDTVDTVEPPDTGPVDCAEIDADEDGADACTDCDDADPARFPGAVEVCDGLDDDCDGAPVEGEVDGDADGQLDCAICDAAGFWGPTRGLAGSDLIAAVDALMDGLICIDYSATTDFMFTELDKDPGTSEVECVYTGRRVVVGDDKPDATDMNTEHTWPQSLGAEEIPAKCDLHHLYPSDADANSVRGNYPFGVVTGGITWQEGGSKLGTGVGGATVFEPRDVHKGNVARSMLYFAHQYGHALSADELALYKVWHAADPVDDREAERTLAILAEQDRANPFVACPELVDAL